MNEKEKLYTVWLERRKAITAPTSFSNKIMERINLAGRDHKQSHDDIPRQYHAHPIARWIAASGLLLLGLFRILYVAGSLYRTNLVMPY